MRFHRCLMLALLVGSIHLATLSAGADKDADDRKKMVGVWQGGWPNDNKPRYELVISAAKITGKNLQDGSSLGEGSFKLDLAKKTIDATGTGGPGKNKTFLGLYSLDGDTLKWCSNNGTRKRPTELAHKPGDDHYLLVLKRKK